MAKGAERQMIEIGGSQPFGYDRALLLSPKPIVDPSFSQRFSCYSKIWFFHCLVRYATVCTYQMVIEHSTSL